jgi:hypothetical protein
MKFVMYGTVVLATIFTTANTVSLVQVAVPAARSESAIITVQPTTENPTLCFNMAACKVELKKNESKLKSLGIVANKLDDYI